MKKLAFAAAGIIVLLAAAQYFNAQELLVRALDWIAGLGSWGPLIFMVIYIFACILFLPGSILTLGAGVLFGLVAGSIIVSISATLGATAAFLVGRYVARDWVAKKIEGHPRLRPSMTLLPGKAGKSSV